MWGWLKRKTKRCTHSKGFGEKWPSNMAEIARFSPYKRDAIGYGVSECAECGKRMFSCLGLHLMGPRMTDVVDGFIAYKISPETFKKFLEENMASHTFELPITRKEPEDE